MKTQFTPGPTPAFNVGPYKQQNSALNAAAPDLYEALQYCVSVLSGEEMTKHSLVKALEKARFAFQKAQGER